jgi:hypothetical protein
MVTLLLEFAIPACFVAVIYLYFRVHYKLRNPKKMTFGAVANKVCAVDGDEIEDWFRQLQKMEEGKTHLVRERRATKNSVLNGILDDVGLNTFLFQSGLFFEKDRIDPAKPSIDYEPREGLVHILIDESTNLRVKVFEARRTMLIKTITRAPFDLAIVQEIFNEYKRIEGDIIGLAGMGQTDICRELLISHLGLTRFYVIEGGGGHGHGDYGPEPA